jgi:hypothetical protein
MYDEQKLNRSNKLCIILYVLQPLGRASDDTIGGKAIGKGYSCK